MKKKFPFQAPISSIGSIILKKDYFLFPKPVLLKEEYKGIFLNTFKIMVVKMKYIKFIALISLLFCLSFSSFQIPDYEIMADKITKKTAKKLRDYKNLVLVGSGGGMMYDVEMMAMSFDYYHEVTIDEARKLIVYVINEYLSEINGNAEIRPYLHDNPFTAKNLEIRIWTCNRDGSKILPDKIDYFSAIEGQIRYYLPWVENQTNRSIRAESYEEAVKTIQTTCKN